MNRRAILLGLVSVPTIVAAGFWDDITTAVTGHVNDLSTRITHTDEIISGGIIGSGKIDTEASGQDFIHNSSGTIGIVSANDGHYIQLGSDFTSSPGPDYHVYISLGGDIDNEKDFNFYKHYEIGPLKAGKGASYYSLPADLYDYVDHLTAFSVVIWCKQFGEYIGSATIKWD